MLLINALLVLLMSTLVTPPGQPSDNTANDFQGAKESRAVTWNLRRVTPPSPLYVDVDDQLVVGAASSQTAEVVTISYRLLLADGSGIKRGQFTVAPLNTRAVKVQTLALAEGFLLSVSLKAAVATTRGQTFARLFIGSGAFGAGNPGYMLMSDYVTTAMAPAFPNGRQLAPTEGPGFITSYQAANALFGVGWLISVPTNTRWRVMGVAGVLSTDAVAGTRRASLGAQVNSSPVWQGVAGAGFGPGVSGELSWYPGATLSDDTLQHEVNTLPDNLILGGTVPALLQVSMSGMDAGDEWVSAFVTVEEWLDNV